MSARQGLRRQGVKRRIGLLALCGFALALSAAPAAQAADPFEDLFDAEAFTPHFQACTSGSPCEMATEGVDLDGNQIFNVDQSGENYLPISYATSTLQAGAHPVLALKIAKEQPNHCLDWAYSCSPEKGYMEQVFKKLAIHLPPGLVADANAAAYCDPYLQWVPGGFGQSTQEYFRWTCTNPDAFVGTGIIYASQCVEEPPPSKNIACYGNLNPWTPSIAVAIRFFLYNDRPRTGEQGHLVMLPADLASKDGFTPLANRQNPRGFTKIDIGITTRGDLSLDTVADNLPDPVVDISRSTGTSCDGPGEPACRRLFAFSQEVQILLLLNGAVGEDQGHPLLTNPTFCDPQTIDTELHGYAHNSMVDSQSNILRVASGDGLTVSDSAPYQATGCDSVPYDPKLSLSLDNSSPDQPPAISSTVSQGQGEATTKKVTVSFPKAFKINDKNKSTFCSESDVAASVDDPGDQDHCAESTRIGTVEASSPVLPIGQTLKGNVYLGGLSGDSIKVSAVLHGFIDLRIDASGAIAQDGRLVTTFDNLPAVPIGQFKLNLEGGDKGLIKTPKVCAPQSVTSTFQSHSGKTATVAAPLDISGCGDPTLDATLSSRRPGAPTDLDLDLRSKGTRLKDVQLLIARQLHWQAGQAFAAKAKSRSIGSIAFTTSAGELETALAAKRTKAGGIKLSALAPRTPSGQLGASEVPSFAGSLFRTTKRQARRKAKGKRNTRTFTPQAELNLFGLPQDDLTAVDLGLKSKGNFSLKNPKGCGKPLNFVAFVTTADGGHLALKDQVRLKGRGC